MKKIFLLATFIFSISTYGQLESKYEKGFKAGYCQAKKEDKGQYTTCETSPRAPRPKTGKESYNDGVIAGYKYYFGKGSSQNALINGAKTLGDSKKFINYGEIIQDNLEKASQSNYSNNNQNSGSSSDYSPSYRGRMDSRTIKITYNNLRKSIKRKYKYSNLPREEKKKYLDAEIADTYRQELIAFEELSKENSKRRSQQ